jgi:glucan 1,3-beta-glucosidase
MGNVGRGNMVYIFLLACANAQLLEIPAVDAIVSSAMLPFEQYMSFGPEN